ncbi:mRNA cap guanine-N7 methyltransferase 1-like [Brassica rapa]|uniref:mRNA cap guanine-N7 methyltransferase 1-like n=1 Tax=Brassica campestris TaxID=3711 RepID=UPI00142D7524|nr:mRNA cap guanine-N7 methyltransferase 1-like [Brassica rapa]
MNPNGESPVSGDLISKKPNGKDGVSSDEPIKCTGQNVVSSAKAVSGDPLSKKPNGKAVVSSAEPITHSSGTGVPKSQPISSCPSLPYLPFNGGDLIKWVKARIWLYVVIDIAEGSIEDCRTRYNGDADQHQVVELDKILEEDAPIVICSCQFDMQYSWTTEARARRALAMSQLFF